ELAGHRWRTYGVAVTPDGQAVVSTGADGCIRVQGLDGKQMRRVLLDGPPEERAAPIHHVRALALTPDGKKATTWRWGPNGGQPVYERWDRDTGKLLINRPDPSRVVSTCQFSPDAQFVLENVYEERAKAPAAGGKGGGGGAPATGLTQVAV